MTSEEESSGDEESKKPNLSAQMALNEKDRSDDE